MAFLRLKNHKSVVVSAKQGNLLWLIKNGEEQGTPRLRAKVAKIDKIYLNEDYAPESYRLWKYAQDHPYAGQIALPYKD